jgi:hypothetical protein
MIPPIICSRMKVIENRHPARRLLPAHHLLYGKGGLILPPPAIKCFFSKSGTNFVVDFTGYQVKTIFPDRIVRFLDT